VAIQFLMLKNGVIGFASLVRDSGVRFGNAGLQDANRMNYSCEKWTLDTKENTPIKV